MPDIILFGACRTAIVDIEDNSASLINLLSGFEIPVGAGDDGMTAKTIERDSAISIEWATISLWKVLPSDIGRAFEQKIDLYLPDGSKHPDLSDAVLGPFTLRDSLTHSIRTGVKGFPIGLPGTYRVVLSVREVQAEAAWNEVAEYPIVILHSV